MKLSIVATLYRSAPYIVEFHRRATAMAEQFAGDDYEIVLVNDGSPDNSLEVAAAIVAVDAHVTVVDLSRNFGHHKAMMTGLRHATGDHVFLLDSDLEEEPEWLVPFAAQMAAEKCDVVYGVQQARKGGRSEQWTGALFYKVFRFFTGLNLPSNIVVGRLMTRRYVDALVQHGESELFMAGLWLITGFDQRPHLVTKHSASETTYTLRKKLAQMVNAITSFSSAPLVSIFFIGSTISLLAGVYTFYLVFRWLFLSHPPGGYTSIMASIWLLGGLIIAFIGMIGIYLARIYTETKARPYTIVRQILRKERP